MSEIGLRSGKKTSGIYDHDRFQIERVMTGWDVFDGNNKFTGQNFRNLGDARNWCKSHSSNGKYNIKTV